MTMTRTRLLSILGTAVLGVAVLVAAAPATAQPVVWQLGRPTWTNQATHPVNVRLDDIQMHNRGGIVRVTALDDGSCAPGAGVPGQKQSQSFSFQWFFDRDITTLRHGDVLNIRLTGQGSENKCMQVNPFIEVKGWGHEFEFLRSGRYYALPHLLNNQSGHDAGERKVRVWREGAVNGQNGTNWIDINLWGFAGNRAMDLHIKYPYSPVIGALVTPQASVPKPPPVATPPPLATPATRPPSVSFRVQGATDMPGSDYKAFWMTQDRWELCEAACRSEAACQSFTYVRAGLQGPQARCWLKNAVPRAHSNQACCVSGVKVTGLFRQ